MLRPIRFATSRTGTTRSRGGALRALIVLVASIVAACTRSTPPPPAPPSSAGAGLDPAPIANAIVEMERVEDLSEKVANRLIEFSDRVRRRDYDGAGAYLTDDFLGTAFGGLAEERVESLPLDIARRNLAVAASRETPLDRERFLRSLEAYLAPLEAIEFVFFKTRGAEFSPDGARGVLRMTAQIIGSRTGGKPTSSYAHAAAEVVLQKGDWHLRRFVAERLAVLEREAPIFRDVARSAGMAQVGPRFGTEGNDSFYWRGAAACDVDRDGLFDILTTTHDRSYLWRNRGDGGFDDITDEAGLAGSLSPGATSVLFFDYDRDGRQDLFCAYVGWTVDGVPHGRSPRLWHAEEDGRFRDVTRDVGMDGIRAPAFGCCIADIDSDGWLDIFVSSYNRLDAVYPNSWYQATNGEPNLLLRNVDGQRFEDVAEAAGVRGRDWAYAAAFADFDEDGDQDLYVANDYGQNSLFRNRGDGTFEDVAAAYGVLDTGNGMAVAWSDLDGDGRLDLYVSNMSSSAGNRILKRLAGSTGGDGKSGPELAAVHDTLVKLASGNSIFLQRDGGFERLPADRGGIGASWAWSASVCDFDLDATPDIYVASGFISGDSLKDT